MEAAAMTEDDLGTQVPDTLPGVRKWSKHDAQTYGDWVRTVPRDQLTRRERRLLRAEREWEATYPEEVARLDAFVGQLVRLTRERRTLAEDVEVELPYTRHLPKGYPKGMRIRVHARYGQMLMGRACSDGTPLLLKREWVERVEEEVVGEGHGSLHAAPGRGAPALQGHGFEGDQVRPHGRPPRP